MDTNFSSTSSDQIVSDTEERLIKLSDNAVRQVEQLTRKAIDGNLKSFRLELRKSIQSIAGSINNQNMSALQSAVSGQLGGGLLGDVANALVGGAFGGGFALPSFLGSSNSLNLSRGQRAVSLHQTTARAVRDI
ncbi:MAG: hypothetical protein EB060_07305 [Proteobacteria bacterium]|nr:hypothetical protein [Pseudomonadota bacterium]